MILDLSLYMVLFSPYLFVIGLYIGKEHVERLAYNGGESSYPEWIRESVEAYRKDNGIDEIDHDF